MVTGTSIGAWLLTNRAPCARVNFASKHGAQNHIQKVCGKKGTEAERKAKVDSILRKRAIASGEISAISAYMGQQVGHTIKGLFCIL